MFSQGYIGVTTQSVSKRFSDHLSIARNKSSKDHSTIHRAINKYGLSGIDIITLVECDKEYAFWLEEKLRPNKGIAWNVAAGGESNTKGMITGRKLTPEHIQRLIDTNSNPTEITRQRKSDGQKRRYSARDPSTLWAPELNYSKKLRKTRVALPSFWRNPKVTIENLHKIHAQAGELYDFYFSNGENIQIAAALKFLNVPFTQKASVSRVLQRFRAGWNPHEDEKWVGDFLGDFFLDNGYLESFNHDLKAVSLCYSKKQQEYLEYLQEKETNGT